MFLFFNNRRQTNLSACKLAQWPDPVIQRRNIDIYVEKSEVNGKESNN